MQPSESASGSVERQLFFRALEVLPGKERAAFLDAECSKDPQLRQRLEGLLRQFEALGTFLEEPVVSRAELTQYRAEPGVLTERPGDCIGRYKLIQWVGEGGVGVVYEAEQAEPVRRLVALKIIKLGMDTKQVVARFEAERQALAVMDHPNIAKVFDAGATDTGRPYFVMELVRGIKITEYCDQNSLPTKQRLELFIRVCQAIQHAHQKGIIHRDIKPANVLVSRNDGVPVPKVIDFGIAKTTTDQPMRDNTLFTACEQFVGTPAYMSPEQAELGGQDIDTRTDIYSLGVLLYELLTGKTPFDTRELMAIGLDEMRRTIREREPARPSTRLASMLAEELTATAKRRASEASQLISVLRGDLDWIVIKALEKDRTRRYDTANGLAMDLQRYLDNEPVLARPPGQFYRLNKLVRRNKLAFAAAAGIASALLCGIGASTWQAARATRAGKEALANARATQQAQVRESIARAQTRRLLYVADINLAHRALEEGSISRADELLRAYEHNAGQDDLRGFEWFALKRLCRGDQAYSFPPQTYIPMCVAFSPDGKLLATGSGNQDSSEPEHGVARDRRGELKLFDAATKRELITFPQQTAWVTSITFSPDGQTLAAARSDGITIFWKLTGEKTAELPGRRGDCINALSFSPDGQALASASSDGMLSIWSTTRRCVDFATNLVHTLSTLAFTPDGRRLAAAGTGFQITLVDTLTTNLLAIPWPGTYIGGLAFSPDGKTLAIANVNTWVRLLDLDSLSRNAATISSLVENMYWPHNVRPPLNMAVATNVAGLGQHQDCVTSVAFLPDGSKLVTASLDNTLKIWDLRLRKAVAVLKGHRGSVLQLAVSADGTTIASISTDRTVRLWRVEREQEADVLGHPAGVWSTCYSGDGKWLASGCFDGSIRLWDAATRQCVQRFPGHGGNVGRLLFSRDNKLLISAGEDELIKIWDVTNPGTKPLATLWGHHGSVYSLCLSPDGRTLVSANGFYDEKDPGVVKFWDLSKRQEIASFRAHTEGIHSMVISPDGRLLATGSFDATLKLWDTATQRPVANLKGHTHAVNGLAFSPDGKTLVSTDGGTLIFWNVEKEGELFRLTDLTPSIDHLLFTRDGRTLVEACSNGNVRLRNVATLKELLTLQGHVGFLGLPVFSPDERILATAGDDGTVRLWPAARFFQN